MTIKALIAIFSITIFININYAISNERSPVILLSNSTKFNYNEIKNLIVFGDSHSACGTNYTDMTYTGRNHSGGKIWPVYLVEFNNMKLWNYARGGAVVDSRIAFHRNDTIDFLKQYDKFYERMANGKKYFNHWNDTDTLITIFIGTNDIYHLQHKCKNESQIFCAKNNNTVNKNINDIIRTIFNIISKIYDVGGRNFLILTPFNKSCSINSNKCYLKNDFSMFNNNLIRNTKILFEKYLDTNFIVYNTTNKFEEIISNCNKYKFKNCINSWKWITNKTNNFNDYFWIDTHISDSANKILAKDINYLLLSINK